VTIDAVASATGGMYATQPTRTPKQTLDGEAFMSLLVTQLRNQDPSSPMDTNQMISQTTQLAMMEKITASSTTSDENFSLQMRTAAASLLGQLVSYTGKDGTTLSGTPSAVSYAGPVPEITIGGVAVPLDAILSISTKPAS
jgi:flagellar basal-body rod modification protein FlgD